MKAYLLITVLSFIQLSVFSQQIEFFNIGIQDKPLANIVISTKKKSEGYFVKNIIVTNDIYTAIKQYVVDNDTHNKPLSNNYHKDQNVCSGNYGFGCYAVQITEKRNDLLYFMDTNEMSVEYFKGLVDLLKKKGIIDVAITFQNIIAGIEILEEFYNEE